MLNKLKIQNFKGWKDTGDIEMAPITLFFGANSSGKSSIGQFLMMLKQTAESSDRKPVFFPGDSNSAVQLGSYQEMVNDRDTNKKISFAYQWECRDAMAFTDPISEQKYAGKFLGFEAEVAAKYHSILGVVHLKYKLLNDFQQQVMSISMNRLSKTESQRSESDYKVESDDYPLTCRPGGGGGWPISSPEHFHRFPHEVVLTYNNIDFVKDFNYYHDILFRSLCYLGPLRTRTARLYSWNGIEPDSVGYTGENTISALLAAKDRKIGIKKRGKMRTSPAKPFAEVIASNLLAMGLIESFKVNRLSENRHEYEVKVQVKGSEALVDLPDVGFGISQVLPVLVQCYYAPPGSIIIMEQPEIHLHPSAQSALADVLIDVIHSKENGADRNIQLIIETHSEHFLRRLQRRIAEEALPRDKVAAYFANVMDSSSQLTPLEIDPYGNIRNWPKDFFGDEMGDIIGHAKAAMDKQKKERSNATGDSHE